MMSQTDAARYCLFLAIS